MRQLRLIVMITLVYTTTFQMYFRPLAIQPATTTICLVATIHIMEKSVQLQYGLSKVKE